MTTIPSGQTVLIVGAGLSGSLLAIYLARLGYKVRLYERRSDPRAAGYSGGRSINLALSARGIWGLQGVGLEREILQHALPMRGRMMHSTSGQLAFQPYSKDTTDAINSISRGGLNVALLHAAAREANVELVFSHRCLDVDLDKPAAVFQDESAIDAASFGPAGPPPGTCPVVTVEADLIIGADGAFSPVRARLQKTDRFEYSQDYLEHGYKELHIPSAADLKIDTAKHDGWALDRNALHIWPRGGAMMIALPNPDKTFTCTLFWPFSGPHGFDRLKTADEVNRFFREQYPDAVPLMPTLAEDFLRNPTSSLVTVRCWPWVHLTRGNDKAVVVLGDAAHAIVPFYGQGMNCAFEDVRVLAELLSQHGGNLARALPEFQSLRKPNADAIADMALENFVEMRDKVGSKLFLWRKKLEHTLHDLFPRSMVPRYNLISFSTVPYVAARQQGERVDMLIRLGLAAVLMVLVLLLGLTSIMRFNFAILAALIIWFFLSETPRPTRRSSVH
jgi:kynurenine 3-monooxygenase